MAIRNSVSLNGNLGADPKVTTLPSGTVVTEFRLATNEFYRDREGQRQSRTMWHNVKAYGKPAEILGQYLSTGSMIAVEGRLSYRDWVDRHEQKHVATEIVVEEFTFLSNKEQSGESTSRSYQTAETPAQLVEEPVAEVAPKTNGKAKRKAKARPKRKSKSVSQAPVAALVEDDELPF